MVIVIENNIVYLYIIIDTEIENINMFLNIYTCSDNKKNDDDESNDDNNDGNDNNNKIAKDNITKPY